MKNHKKVTKVSPLWPSTQESAKEVRELWSRLELKAVSNMKKVAATPVHEEAAEVEEIAE